MDDELARSSIELARNQGQMAGYAAASKLLLREDKVLIEILRAKAWQKDGCKTIHLGPNEAIEGVPTGWPEGTNGDEYVGEYLEKMFAAPDSPGTVPSPAGPVLKSFRESLDA